MKTTKNKVFFAIIFCSVLFIACEQPFSDPTGGKESSHISDFVGYSYISDFAEEFSIEKKDEVLWLTMGTPGYQTKAKIIETKIDKEHGTFYLIQCSHHSNWQCAQYPDYAEENPHSDCYTVLYVPSISEKAVSWATFYLTIEGKGTACFKNRQDAQKYMYYDKIIWAYISEGGKKLL